MLVHHLHALTYLQHLTRGWRFFWHCAATVHGKRSLHSNTAWIASKSRSGTFYSPHNKRFKSHGRRLEQPFSQATKPAEPTSTDPALPKQPQTSYTFYTFILFDSFFFCFFFIFYFFVRLFKYLKVPPTTNQRVIFLGATCQIQKGITSRSQCLTPKMETQTQLNLNKLHKNISND